MTKGNITICIISFLWSICFFLLMVLSADNANSQSQIQLPEKLSLALSIAANRDQEIIASHGSIIDEPRRGGFHHLETTIIGIVAQNPIFLEPAMEKAIQLAPKQREAIIKRVSISFPQFFKSQGRIILPTQKHTQAQLIRNKNHATKASLDKVINPSRQNNEALKFWPQLPSNGGTDGYANIDPLEGLNRVFFYGNGALDFLIFEPLAKTYRFFVPDIAKPYILRAFNNLGEPLVFVNDLVQLEFQDAAVSFSRFVINSTAGLAGLVDVAENLGLPSHKSDFGKTLYNLGVGEGIYLVLPFFGPTSARDSLGLGANMLLDPRSWILASNTRISLSILEGIAIRERLIDPIDYLVENSEDSYESVRAWTWQKRQNEIQN